MKSKKYVEWFYQKYPHPKDEWTSKKPEHIVLIELINKYKLKSVFEIGTWLGYATLLMWLHPNITNIKSIDKDTNDFNEDKTTGVYCRKTNAKIKICNSRNYIIQDNENYDLVFIDGEHFYDDVKGDTEFAFKLNPKVIVWHDYIDSPYVKKYINELIERGKEIYTVKNVNIAYMILK